MKLNKDIGRWSKVRADAFLDGSIVQAKNVLEMALQDIASLGAEIERIERLKAIDVRAFFERMGGLERNDEVWALACSAVAVAGMRAQQLRHKDIDAVCASYVVEMGKLTKSPELQMEDDGAPQTAPFRWRIRWRKLGDHYQCRLYSQRGPGGTYYSMGQLTMGEQEWRHFKEAWSHAEFVDFIDEGEDKTIQTSQPA